METTTTRPSLIRSNWPLFAVAGVLGLLPFFVALATGDSVGDVFTDNAGNSKFIQGLMIEVFILAIFAISYDLLLGVTGLLSFGHAMFFALPAYITGIMLKSFSWGLWQTFALVIIIGVIQAVLFAIVLPRVKGITFALVTLGMASVFDIVIKTRELADYTGADVGLQGVPRPDFLNPATDRLNFYFVALLATLLIYLIYKRFVDSPTGRVCIATRENENRAQMLGFNTFYFKLAALIVSGVTAALAGMLNTLYKPIVSPEIAGLGFTVDGLLMILIGGMGTLSGPMIGAGVFRLTDFYLNRWFGEPAGFILGAVYVALVLFVPYGIVGTYRQRALRIKEGRAQLAKLVSGQQESETEPGTQQP